MTTHFSKLLLIATCAMIVGVALPAQSPAPPDAGGWSANPIPVLMRQAERPPDSQLASLMEGLALKSSARERRTDGLRVTGDSWRLDVFGDGSSGEFVDQAIAAGAHQYAVDPAKALSAQALETAGRAYIERTLSRTIVLQPAERLVFETTSLRTEGGVARDGTGAHAAVAEARVVFSREIGGIPVVGAGSKIAITFRGDGPVESFRYDWPKYTRTSREQRLAPPLEILRRIQQVASVRTRAEVAGDLVAPRNIERMAEPMRLGAGVQLQDLNCGYYDPGLKNRHASAPLQAGCYYHVVHSQGEEPYVTTAAYSGAVPAAASPERDTRWPEVEVLRGVYAKQSPARSAGSTDKPTPVPPRPRP